MRHRAGTAVAVLAFLLVAGPGCTFRSWRFWAHVERGKASWYGNQFHGRTTASGEVFDQEAMTAAHRKLPFGTIVRVRNLCNDKTVVVRINDRGPFIRGRIIDLSKGAARRIGMIRDGVVPVRVMVLEKGDGRTCW